MFHETKLYDESFKLKATLAITLIINSSYLETASNMDFVKLVNTKV